MTRMVVDVDALDELLDRMAAFAARLESAEQDVATRVRRLQAVWTGAAAAEQADAQARWAAGVQDMADALTQLHRIAGTARSNYLGAVRANLGMWT